MTAIAAAAAAPSRAGRPIVGAADAIAAGLDAIFRGYPVGLPLG